MGGKDDSWSDFDQPVDGRSCRTEADNRLRDWANDDASESVRNPFERFKDFIDSNLGILSEGFKRLPSNITELKAQMQAEREARREEEVEIWKDWTGSHDSPDHIRMQMERRTLHERNEANTWAKDLLQRAQEKNNLPHVSLSKIGALYKDNEGGFGLLDEFATPLLSNGGACYYKSETVDNLPSTARWGWPAPRYRWLSVEWFKRSPYSPVRAQKDLPGHNLRAAFEDLICASLDKPMVSTEKVGARPYGKAQSTYLGPGLDWMLSLQCRGVLPPQLPSWYAAMSWSQLKDSDEEWHQESFYGSKRSSVRGEAAEQLRHRCTADLEILADEISIKSTTDFDAAPLPAQVEYSWRAPTTEQDLYDQMLPKTIPEGPWRPAMLGNKSEDLEEADDALWEALANKDADAAAGCLEAYYNAHGNLDDLLEDPYEVWGRETQYSPASPWYPILNEALRRSKIPDCNGWKAQAVDSSSYVREELDQRPLSLKEHDREKLQYPADLFAHSLTGALHPSLEELKAVVKKLETEAAERERERKSNQRGETTTRTAAVQKPDILSQLTTTQTTRMPDGTVMTKVVMKQRFADGREESHESVQTTHERDGGKPERSSTVQEAEEKKEKKTNGWFWN